MKYEIEGKVVFITGASSGIGRSTAIEFARHGAKVVLVARTKDLLESVHHQIQSEGGQSMVGVADVLKIEELTQVIQQTLKTFGVIDILINNAGAGVFRRVEDTIGHPDYFDMMSLNYHAPVILTQLMLPMMLKRGSGQLVYVSSVLGKRAIPFMSAYAASKFALDGFTQSLRVEVKKQGVDVILICPGITKTQFYRRINQENGDQMVANMPGIMDAEGVAKAIYQACHLRKREVILTYTGRWLVRLSHWFPKFMDRMLNTHSPKPEQLESNR